LITTGILLIAVAAVVTVDAAGVDVLVAVAVVDAVDVVGEIKFEGV
jgi:hypothetical protein